MAKFSVSIADTIINKIMEANQGQFIVGDNYVGNNFSAVVYKKRNVDTPNYYRNGEDFIYMVGTYMWGGKNPLSTMVSLLDTFSTDNIIYYKKTIGGIWSVMIHKNQRTYIFNDYYGLYDTYYTLDTVSNSLVDCTSSQTFNPNKIDEFSYIMDMFQLGAFPGCTPFNDVKRLKRDEYAELNDVISVNRISGDISFHYKYINESESLKKAQRTSHNECFID